MTPKLQKKWTKALTDGSHKQGQGLLRSADSRFCCLGVLLDVAGFPWGRDVDGVYYCGRSDNKRVFPSTYQLKKIGLSNDDAEEFANMNDNGISFATIAKRINASR